MDDIHRQSAENVRSLIESGRCPSADFRAALSAVPPIARESWADRVLGLDEPPADGPDLPPGCVPYLPCAVDALLRLTAHAPVGADDVFVDIGSGVGRAAALVHLLTGAKAVGMEVQSALVSASRALVTRLNLAGVSFVPGDVAQSPAALTAGSVYFLYCPFSGDRLVRLLADLEAVARARPIRVCTVDLPLPPCPWLEALPPASLDLAIYRSVARA